MAEGVTTNEAGQVVKFIPGKGNVTYGATVPQNVAENTINTSGGTAAEKAAALQQLKGMYPPPSVITSAPANQAVNDVNTTLANYNVSQTTGSKKPADKLADIETSAEDLSNAYRGTLANLDAGHLTPSEQASINATQALFDQTKKLQEIANKNYEATVAKAGIASGRNRYAPEEAEANIKNSIDNGILKIQNLDLQATKAISEMKQAMLDKDYSHAKDLYDSYNDTLKMKRQTILDVHDMAIKEQQLALERAKAFRTTDINNYEYYKQKGGQKNFYDWSNAKTGSTESVPTIITADIVKQRNLPEGLIGLSSTQFSNDIQAPNPPSWFKSYIEELLQQNLPDEAVQTQWENWKQSPPVVEFIAMESDGGGLSSGGGGDLSGW